MNWGVNAKFKNPSLRVRLILYCSTAIAGLWVISSITTFRYLKHHYTEQLRQFGTVVLENFIKSGKNYLVAYDYHRLRSILQESQYIGSLAYVAIYDDTGRLIAYYPSYDSPAYEQIDKFTTLSKNERDTVVSELPLSNDHFLVFEKNVYHNGDTRPVGKVRVALSQLKALAPFHTVLSRVAVFGVLHVAVLLAILAWFLSRFVQPIKELAKRCVQIDVISADSFLGIRPNAPEIAQLMHALHALSMRIVSQEREIANQRVHAELGRISSQVAHDIRSPLTALKVVAGHLGEVAEEKRVLIRNAVQRIEDIANDLAVKKHWPSATGKAPGATGDAKVDAGGLAAGAEGISVQLLSSVMEPLISEKRLQWRHRCGIQMCATGEAAAYGLFARVQPVEFKRLLSNLINNAVEAMNGEGNVSVALLPEGDCVRVTVSDTGPGIPPEILEPVS